MTQTKLAYPIYEAFTMIGVSRSRGYKLIATGTLKTYKAGKVRLCSHKALIACQQAMEKAGADERKVA